MGALRDDNFFVVHGWMINRLGLRGTELDLYAIIYGFSQTTDQQFHGSLQYLSDWTNVSRRSVLSRLQALCDKGLLVKNDVYENGVKTCEYRCITVLPGGEETSPGVVKKLHRGGEETSPGVVKKLHRGGEETSPGVVKKLHRGGEETSPNIDIDNISDIDIDKDKGVPPTPAPEKKTPKAKKADTEAILARYAKGNEETMKLLREWLKVRKAKRAPETEYALALNLDKLQALAQESRLTVNAYLEAVIMRGWAAFYPIRENVQQRGQMQPTRSMVKTEQEHAAGMSASGMGGW